VGYRREHFDRSGDTKRLINEEINQIKAQANYSAIIDNYNKQPE
jgi:hypothetical protein